MPLLSSIVMCRRTAWLPTVANARTSSLRVPARSCARTANTWPCAARRRLAKTLSNDGPGGAFISSSSQPRCSSEGWSGTGELSFADSARVATSRRPWSIMIAKPIAWTFGLPFCIAIMPDGISHSPAWRTLVSNTASSGETAVVWAIDAGDTDASSVSTATSTNRTRTTGRERSSGDGAVNSSPAYSDAESIGPPLVLRQRDLLAVRRDRVPGLVGALAGRVGRFAVTGAVVQRPAGEGGLLGAVVTGDLPDQRLVDVDRRGTAGLDRDPLGRAGVVAVRLRRVGRVAVVAVDRVTGPVDEQQAEVERLRGPELALHRVVRVGRDGLRHREGHRGLHTGHLLHTGAAVTGRGRGRAGGTGGEQGERGEAHGGGDHRSGNAYHCSSVGMTTRSSLG